MITLLAAALLAANPGTKPIKMPPLTERASYEPKDRVAYLAEALQAMGQVKPGQLAQAYQYASALERTACGSPVERLRAECLTQAARKFCKSRPKAELHGCTLTLDVIVSNVLAEKQLIPMEQRYELMRRHKDHRRELERHLRRLQGSLAANFQLAMGPEPAPASMAQAIDTWCLATADQTNLSWQTCAASLVWFIGSAT
ncbi:MAG: hypothetical protein ACT4TC_14410 [Myxococcaceae bacterium]